MSENLADLRNIRFILYEVLNIEKLTEHPRHQDHDRETFDMIIDAAYQLTREVFWPTYQESDRIGAQFDGEKTTVPKSMHDIWRQCSEGGWFAPSADYDYGGQQLPLTLYSVILFLFNCGDPSAAMYVSGAGGAARLIESFGDQALKDTYLLKLYSGEWGGTMALTEPDVGTSLGDITTIARKSPDGDHYLLKGTKRFISSGDHDITDNIVHPVLARVEGAPQGVKGLSLFIVPKYRPDSEGNAGEFNDVVTTGIEHKLGLKAQATATLALGENDACHGWLVGEESRGLKYMFQLMNEARVFTGLQAVGGASAAYHCALQYTRERVQGRDITDRDPSSPQIPIIKHPDVRRMLMLQKSFVEGCLGMILQGAKMADMMELTEDEDERNQIRLVLELLTPCCKAYVSDGAFESITTALQCLGGVGFSEEFPVAQILRDNKVFSIYEGANGVQAMDLLGRKVPMENGAAVRALMTDMAKTLDDADRLEPLKPLVEKVREVQNEVIAATMHLGGLGMSGELHLYICNAMAYLEMFSQLVIAWQLLNQACVAQKTLDAGTDEETFYKSKIETARFYINNVAPHAIATAQVLKSNERTALDFDPDWF